MGRNAQKTMKALNNKLYIKHFNITKHIQYVKIYLWEKYSWICETECARNGCVEGKMQFYLMIYSFIYIFIFRDTEDLTQCFIEVRQTIPQYYISVSKFAILDRVVRMNFTDNMIYDKKVEGHNTYLMNIEYPDKNNSHVWNIQRTAIRLDCWSKMKV